MLRIAQSKKELLSTKWNEAMQLASKISSELEKAPKNQRLQYCGILSQLALNVALVGCATWRTPSFPVEVYFASFSSNPSELELTDSLKLLGSICEEVVESGLNDRLSGRQFCYAVSVFECYFRLHVEWNAREFIELMTCLLEVQELACYELLGETDIEEHFNNDWKLKRELLGEKDVTAAMRHVCWKQYPSLIQVDLE